MKTTLARSILRVLVLAVLAASTIVPVVARPELRVMAPYELASSASIIARARVDDVDKSHWGDFRQVATLELVDVIEGDFTLGEVRVASQSLLGYTNDSYEKKQEYLVFLWFDAGFYRTVNYQYGQFRIEGDVVKGWRNSENVPSDKPYYSVREEIEQILAGLRAPAPAESAPPPPSQPQGGATGAAPKPRPSASKPPPRVIRPERP